MATDLFSDNRTNDQPNELKAKLFGVEVELRGEELRNLNGREDRSEKEDHRVGAGGNHDAGVLCQSQRRDELQGSDGCRIDAAERKIRLFESCKATNGVLDVVVTDEACLRAEKAVENQLHTIDLGGSQHVDLLPLCRILTIARSQKIHR